jgi:hypothetical protein
MHIEILSHFQIKAEKNQYCRKKELLQKKNKQKLHFASMNPFLPPPTFFHQIIFQQKPNIFKKIRNAKRALQQ